MGKVMCVIPAAGESKRMGTGVNKQLLSLCGKTVLEHAINSMSNVECVEGIILVVKPGEEEYFRQWSQRLFGNFIKKVVPGGGERQESVYKGICSLPPDTGIVLIHDGARPLVEPVLIEKVVLTARKTGAATLGVPVKDTVKMTGDDKIVLKTIPREHLWLVQTPQAFQYQIISEAYNKALTSHFTGTDDASLVEMSGYPVSMVLGSYSNIKITTPEDLIMAEALMR